MKVLIAGSSGMIGELILKHCLNSVEINEVRSLVRKPSITKHEKLKEIVIENFEDYSKYIDLFKGIDVAFFCIGVYTGQVADDLFKIITVNFAAEFDAALKRESPKVTLCLLSGMGADRTEKSRTAFAKYKGMAENQISALNMKFYTFRPAYIYPVEPRKEPNIGYQFFRFIYPAIKYLGKDLSIRSTELASAMFKVGLNGAETEVLEDGRYYTVREHRSIKCIFSTTCS
jgi:uncharacterized protein YbjT (DUF2867 family)